MYTSNVSVKIYTIFLKELFDCINHSSFAFKLLNIKLIHMNLKLRKYCLFLFLSFFSFFAYPVAQKVIDIHKSSIELKDEGKEFRSENNIVVIAHFNEYILDFEIVNYQDDEILIEIFNSKGILQLSSRFDYYNDAFLDVSSLPEGEYTLNVQLENTYTGFFYK